MKENDFFPFRVRIALALIALAILFSRMAQSAPAALLFEDDFNRGIPGWTAVQPPGTYLDGPMRWQYDIVHDAFLENSNIYTDNATASPSGTAVMLINDTVASEPYTFKARLTAADDDGFGLVFGYQNPTNVYRVTFARQNRTSAGYPWWGWTVDQKVDNVMTPLFGGGTPDYVSGAIAPAFVNTLNQPFEVTISVNANHELTLIVVDDPDGTGTGTFEHRLVENMPLPGSAAGKVGLLQWGSGGTPTGGTLRSFRIQNPTLEPAPLTGDPDALKDWTPIVTLRDDGAGGFAGLAGVIEPIWSLALGANGPYGTLHENSDALGGNDPQGQIDFTTGAVVAGDENWTDYVVKARVIPADDDGHGILLRYQNETNFYRIALRAQTSASGTREGLSIQKSVNGVFEEIYFDSPVKYDPPSNVPYEITAAIIGHRLQVLVRGNLNTTPTTHVYGPFDLTGDTLDKGKIGLFSWAMSRTEFDWVRVYQIDGVPIEIASAYGPATPEVGLQSFAPGTQITASVPAEIVTISGFRRVSTGWVGFGSVPASGTGSSVTFTLNEISGLTWNWRTDYRLATAATPGGTVTSSGEWHVEGTTANVQAVPDEGFVFVGWSGSSASLEPRLDLSMVRPYSLTARFKADADRDGLPDDWEMLHFGALAQNGGDDADSDLASNADEYRAGTNPKFKEARAGADPFHSPWENSQRDPALPGILVIRDFGNGFRGLWENSNDFRGADDPAFIGADAVVPNVSFDGPRMVARPAFFPTNWIDFAAEVTFSVGDDDGTCVYFRYQDEMNWYRVTLVAESNTAPWRALYGVTIQKRVNGVFSEIAQNPAIAPDPADVFGYKRMRVRIRGEGQSFDVTVEGWNVFLDPPAFDAATAVTTAFTDDSLTWGRLAIGAWGQSGGNSATPSNPVTSGVLIEEVNASSAFSAALIERWDTAPLPTDRPPGWEDPLGIGVWQWSAHGSMLQTADTGTATTGTTEFPKADADGPILVGPEITLPQYLIEARLHPFDNDGVGFIFDYADPNNYSRALFVAEASSPGRIPQGLSVSRKSAGVWSDVFTGDSGFLYTPGVPFDIRFVKNSQEHRLTARDVDTGATATWAWPLASSPAGTRAGLAAWQALDGHFDSFQLFHLVSPIPVELRIETVAFIAGELVLTVLNPSGGAFQVQSSPAVPSTSWTPVEATITGNTARIPLSPSASQVFFQLQKL